MTIDYAMTLGFGFAFGVALFLITVGVFIGVSFLVGAAILRLIRG